MKKKTFSIELPFFCGFYESPLFNSDTLYYEFSDDNLDYYREQFDDETLTADDLDIDFGRFADETSRLFVDKFMDACNELKLVPSIVERIEFKELDSPSYYNFRTDRIYVKLTLGADGREALLDFFDKEKDILEKRIYEDWTSCDGFMSYMSNDYDEWVAELEKDEPDERYIGIALQYLMEILYKKFSPSSDDYTVSDSIIMDTYEDIYIGEYIICTKTKSDEKNE